MVTPFDPAVADAIFTPLAEDGGFDPDIARYLGELGQARPSIILAFPPKAAGTYLRSAAISAVGGQLVRTVQAQGGRDATFYLPTFILYYTRGIPSRPLVTHVHMQALAANRRFIEALDLKPVVMIRPLADMLASYLDELEDQPLRPDKWLNIKVPSGYPTFSAERKGDFIIELIAPWYVSFFSTWWDYAKKDARVLLLDYDDFRADPAANLERLLTHSHVPRSRQQCQAALDEVWGERAVFRFNRGVSGQGQTRFTSAQMDKLRRLIAYYADLEPIAERLISKR